MTLVKVARSSWTVAAMVGVLLRVDEPGAGARLRMTVMTGLVRSIVMLRLAEAAETLPTPKLVVDRF